MVGWLGRGEKAAGGLYPNLECPNLPSFACQPRISPRTNSTPLSYLPPTILVNLTGSKPILYSYTWPRFCKIYAQDRQTARRQTGRQTADSRQDRQDGQYRQIMAAKRNTNQTANERFKKTIPPNNQSTPEK